MSARAAGKAWTAHAQAVADFSLARPEDESTWSAGDRAEYGELLAGVLRAAAQHDAVRGQDTATWHVPPQP